MKEVEMEKMGQTMMLFVDFKTASESIVQGS